MPKAKKDPRKPKRGKSAYLYFVEVERQKIAGSGADFGQVSKDIGEKWKNITDVERKQYDKLAAQDKIRYEDEMENYSPSPASSDDEGEVSKGKKKRKKKDPFQPKRNLSAFMFYSNTQRPGLKEKHPGATIGDLAKKIGASWQAMNSGDRTEYDKMAANDKIRYQNDMEEYNANKSTAEE